MIETIRRIVLFASAAAGALSVSACASARLPQGVTTQAGWLHQDWSVFFYSGLGVAAIVYTLILVPLFVWRKRSDGLPPQFRGNNPLEITYTIIPLLIVAGLFALTYRNETAVEAMSARPDLAVDVTAFDWSWRFAYPSLGIVVAGTPEQPPQLVLPAGKTIRIRLTSADVNHAFWVPDFLFKRDAIAGVENQFDWNPTRIGIYRGECGEFCGLHHADMTFTVQVVSPRDFARWANTYGSR
jgi:cytochrome c oxidase subunit 2